MLVLDRRGCKVTLQVPQQTLHKLLLLFRVSSIFILSIFPDPVGNHQNFYRLLSWLRLSCLHRSHPAEDSSTACNPYCSHASQSSGADGIPRSPCRTSLRKRNMSRGFLRRDRCPSRHSSSRKGSSARKRLHACPSFRDTCRRPALSNACLREIWCLVERQGNQL